MQGALAAPQSSGGSCKPVEVDEGFGKLENSTACRFENTELIESIGQSENMRWPSEHVRSWDWRLALGTAWHFMTVKPIELDKAAVGPGRSAHGSKRKTFQGVHCCRIGFFS